MQLRRIFAQTAPQVSIWIRYDRIGLYRLNEDFAMSTNQIAFLRGVPCIAKLLMKAAPKLKPPQKLTSRIQDRTSAGYYPLGKWINWLRYVKTIPLRIFNMFNAYVVRILWCFSSVDAILLQRCNCVI